MAKEKKETKNNNLSGYTEMIVIFLISVGITAMFAFSRKNFGAYYLIHLYMSNFLIITALAKFSDLKNFIESFKQYDPIALKYPQYAVIYPMTQLFLGVMYARNSLPIFVSFLTFSMMSIGAYGIFKAKKDKTLTNITLFEDISLAVMAAYNLYILFM